MENLILFLALGALLSSSPGRSHRPDCESEMLVPTPDSSHVPGFESAVLFLTGASSMEELHESEVERYERLAASPLPLNTASASRLKSSGLFSAYQIAVLLDARQSGGPILSLSELALLDGFSEAFARALGKFISLDTDIGSVFGKKKAVQQSLTLGGTLKEAGGANAVSWRFKYLCSKDGRWEAGLRNHSAGLAFYGRRHLSKLILGDFNARFGQGLAMWSGFSLSGLSATVSRNPTGLSPSHSSSSDYSLRGAAAEWTFSRRARLCAAAFVRNGKAVPVGNFSRSSPKGEWGVTILGTGLISTDLRRSAGKFDFFCEAGYDFRAIRRDADAASGSANSDSPNATTAFRSISFPSPSLLAGIVWNPRYATSVSLLLRHYPSDFAGTYSGSVRSSTKVRDETGLILSLRSSSLTLAAEALRRPESGYSQCRLLALYTPASEGPWGCSLRLAQRLRAELNSASSEDTGGGNSFSSLFGSGGSLRSDLRADLSYAPNAFSLALRANALLYRAPAWLGYSELAYRGSGGRLKCSAFARFTAFNVRNWDDRIYAYEHDARGYFTVPAYYGRGYALSFYATLKYRPFFRGVSLSLRCSYLRRSVGGVPVPDTLTLRLQTAVDL
ncbi:MAG: hypothetical protein Q4B16_05920 [Bacteroidia bacterium]|nr:hypothetical protein [Bacteroidia bacterium]